MLARASLFLLLLAGGCQRPSAGSRPPGTEGRGESQGAPRTAKPALDAAWMQTFVERFASDAMAGRYTLDPSMIEGAATALTTEYAALGLAKIGDEYRTPFDFPSGTIVARAHHIWVEASGPARALPHEQSATLSEAAETVVVADVTFLGARAIARPPRALRDRIVLIRDPAASGSPPDHADLRAVAERVAAAGARALVVVSDRNAADSTPWPIPVIALRTAAAESIASAAGTSLARLTGERDSVPLAGVRLSLAPQRIDRIAQAHNVIAWIPGAEKPDELVLVGAHYDHIGTSAHGLMCRGPDDDTICNGADDNASGTGVVLAIAKALSAAGYRPKRTLVFAHFAAEELGLHGSKALANHPPAAAPFAGAKIVAMVNFDMVGRLGKDGLWVGAVGSSSAWMPLLGRIGDHGIPTVYERSVTARSDHASFYEHDIPVLFFFTGLHADYHKPGDEVAAMNFAGMATIAQLALELTVALGDGAPIPFTPPGDDDGLVTRMPGSDVRTVEPAPHPPR